LPPAAVFRAGVGLTFGGRVAVDVDFGLGVDAFVFVGNDHFWEHELHRFSVPHERVSVLFGGSRIMNGYRMDHGRFVVEGLGRDHIAAVTHREIRVVESIHGSHDRVRVEPEHRAVREERHDHR